MSIQPDGRRLTEFFFTRESPLSEYYVCQCGKRRKKGSTSWTSLTSHIKSAHPEYAKFIAEEGVSQLQIDQLFCTSKALKNFGWLDFIINNLLPFSFVERETIRTHGKYESMALSTFMDYMSKLTTHAEQKIAALLPEKGAIVFDGWSSGSTGYIAVFVSFKSSNDFGHSVRLLGFSPVEDETDLGSEEHVKYLDYVLELFDKTWENVVCVIGDNCNANKCIADLRGVLFVGCASHRFNLAVCDILEDNENTLSSTNALMPKLKGLLLGAKLRKITHLLPCTRSHTRWSSTFEMMLRYFELKIILPQPESEEVDGLCLTAAVNRRAKHPLYVLRDLESVTKTLQKSGTTLADVRVLFDAATDIHPSTESRLSSTATIVNSPLFEAAAVKIQLENGHSLSREEHSVMTSLQLPSQHALEYEQEASLFANRALKKQRMCLSDTAQLYGDISFILLTSNICERLFSTLGYVLNDRRKSIAPTNLESQLFLHSISDLWDSNDIDKTTLF